KSSGDRSGRSASISGWLKDLFLFAGQDRISAMPTGDEGAVSAACFSDSLCEVDLVHVSASRPEPCKLRAGLSDAARDPRLRTVRVGLRVGRESQVGRESRARQENRCRTMNSNE